MAKNLQRLVEEHTFPKVGKVPCSFGLTSYRKEESFDSLTNRVDKAMYLAKEQGRNRVVSLK